MSDDKEGTAELKIWNCPNACNIQLQRNKADIKDVEMGLKKQETKCNNTIQKTISNIDEKEDSSKVDEKFKDIKKGVYGALTLTLIIVGIWTTWISAESHYEADEKKEAKAQRNKATTDIATYRAYQVDIKKELERINTKIDNQTFAIKQAVKDAIIESR